MMEAATVGGQIARHQDLIARSLGFKFFVVPTLRSISRQPYDFSYFAKRGRGTGA
jgi:hypothetical protein